MPLHIQSISSRTTKGAILAWLLATEAVKKQQVGAIEIRGEQVTVDVPDGAGVRLAKHLDGAMLGDRRVDVWCESNEVAEDRAAFFSKLLDWLQLEERAEVEQFNDRASQAAGVDTSVCLTQLRLQREDQGLGGYAYLTFGRANKMAILPATELSVGTPVIVAAEGQGPVEQRRGVVTRLDNKSIDVACKQGFSEDVGASIRIDMAQDEVSMQRCKLALHKAMHAQEKPVLRLCDVLLGQREPEFNQMDTVQFFNHRLDTSQQESIRFALSAKDVAIIHGPPGTGKTTTLVELIRQAVRRGEGVLVCAPSNLAVDNLFERLLAAGEQVIRLGHVVRVSTHLQEHTLSAMALIHPDMKQVKKLRIQARDQFRKAQKFTRAKVSSDERRALRDEGKALLSDARKIEAQVVQAILDDAQIVCATCTGLNTDLLGGRWFELAVIDEACQAVEPACWVPISRADKLVLAGDHCQLPPTILSREAAAEGMAKSLMERLLEQVGPEVAKMLTVQYRMHSDIMTFSSHEFYARKLSADASVAQQLLVDMDGVCGDELSETAVHFIDTSGAGFVEKQEEAGLSWLNEAEASLALKKVNELIDLGVQAEDIAIITPYAAQVKVLRGQLADSMVEIGTVDGFQGREKEVVILSLVRSNDTKQLGFLKDIRRMNVALTRARRKLVVIGDSATMTTHAFYERMLDHFDAIGAYHGMWEE